MLELEGIETGYGETRVVHGLDLTVREGTVHALLGRNGVGKSTTLKSVIGQLPVTAGTVRLAGQQISGRLPHDIARLGVAYVPETRDIFGALTVRENLELAGRLAGPAADWTVDRIVEFFPNLAERLNNGGHELSGGEQQMLATARALCTEPKVLLLDEPTEGLQPSMIAAIRDVIVRLRGEGTAILLVEQRIDAVLAVANRVTFLENGQTRETWDAADLRADHSAIDRYLGV